jgi:hypothetical protein
MWTHSDVAVLLKASQAAVGSTRERYMDSQTLLDHWDRVVQDFIDRTRCQEDGVTPGLYARAHSA